MTIIVAPLSQVRAQINVHRPDRVISLLDPGAPFPDLGYGARHLRLAFHDVEQGEDWETAPNKEHVHEVIAFVRSWTMAAPLLIHCHAGISRSTATAFIAACALDPHAHERDLAAALKAASPQARPNRALIALADDALGRAGRMRKRFGEVYPRSTPPEVIENEAFTLPAGRGRG